MAVLVELEGTNLRGGSWLRVRSLDVSARLPRRDSASLRDSTSCRLGLAMGWAEDLRPLAPGGVMEWDGTERILALLEIGEEASASTVETSAAEAATVISVRVARASAALRTRTGVDMYRLSAFLPALVRALRRSRAASRLDVLAMSAQ